MRAPFALVLAVALAVSSVAVARTRTSGSLRVTKRSVPSRVRLFWVDQSGQGQGEALLYAIPDDIAVGEEFDLIDSQGTLGRVKVTRVEDAYPQCKETRLKRATAKYLAQPSRTGNADTVAFGPVGARSATTRARVLLQNQGQNAPAGDSGPALPRGQLYQRMWFDLDGDGRSDLVRDASACPQTSQQRGPIYCYDTHARKGKTGEWVVVSHAELKYCY